MSPRWRHGPILLTAALLWLGGRCSAQSLEQRLDDEAFVRSLMQRVLAQNGMVSAWQMQPEAAR